jgi:ribosomal protein S12 methylthiotransferase
MTRRTEARNWAGLPPYLYTDKEPRLLTTPSYMAYIKIAEGCDHPCTFCAIPRMRGRLPQSVA